MTPEQVNKVIAVLESGRGWASDTRCTVAADIDAAIAIMREVAAEPVALKMWPHRVNHVSELGYVVWRDVFEGNMKCSLLDAVLAHKTAVFVCEDDANEYCAFINKSPQEAAISEAHAQGVREAAPKWLPIESAPKDGRTLLLGYYNSSGKWRTMRGQWFSQDMIDEEWEEPEYASEGWYETCVENDDMPTCWWTEPTHWMPLTAAPEAP